MRQETSISQKAYRDSKLERLKMQNKRRKLVVMLRVAIGITFVLVITGLVTYMSNSVTYSEEAKPFSREQIMGVKEKQYLEYVDTISTCKTEKLCELAVVGARKLMPGYTFVDPIKSVGVAQKSKTPKHK